MESFYIEIREQLQEVCKQDELARKSLFKYLAKQIWTANDRNNLLSSLSSVLLVSSKNSCLFICKTFGPLTVDLLHRCASVLENAKVNEEDLMSKHEQICMILSWLCSLSLPCITQFTVAYLEKHGAPFKRLCQPIKSNKKVLKKRKKMMPQHFGDVLEATYNLIMFYPSLLSFHWQWSVLIDCLQNEREAVGLSGCWYLKKILACGIGLCIDAAEDLHNSEHNQLMLNCQIPNVEEDDQETRCSVKINKKKQSHTQGAIVSSDLSPQLVAACGILLHRSGHGDEENSNSDFVITEAMQPKVQSVAVAVSEGKAVLLEGPVGCGKTALVEHLASITGHSSPPFISKIQLSDDTDSKTLTGTYVCTNIPGEFLWQPGLLVRACRKGYWMLMEDIDLAPMDVISLLLPLIESGQLSIPGHFNESISVSTNFRLFMTRRTNTSHSPASSAGVNMLLKHARTVTLDTICEADLKQIIVLKYPNLSSIVDKLLIIYQNLKENKSALQYTITQRKPSTRDLLKWCQRISSFVSSFGVSDISTAVAMSAIDCFVASCPKPDSRKLMVEEIVTQLNLSSDKAEYYCESYKPDIVTGKHAFTAGRSSISRIKTEKVGWSRKKQPFASTRHASILLERIASCVEACEPALLVGETGVGKTSSLQYLAQETGRELHVVNMSQQSSSSDLLGGYKPAQLLHLVAPVRDEFEMLFSKTFVKHQNVKFLTHIQTCFANKRYNDLWQLMMHSCKAALKRLSNDKKLDKKKLRLWKQFTIKLEDLRLKLKTDSPIAFNFVEGKLSRCIENGDWLLLDEINLAASDTLECLSGLLESQSGSIVLMERGDAKPITRHKEFRLFAAMNPATDVGKRNLSEGVQNRFTEVFVDEPTEAGDIATIVDYYLKKRTIGGGSAVSGIVTFYSEVRKLANQKLVDGAGRKPHYSLRTLCRSLRYVVDNSNVPLEKALYEGFCLSFLTALDRSSHPLVIDLIVSCVVGKKNLKSILSQALPKPDHPCVTIEGHHIRCGQSEPHRMPHYIITQSVQENLRDLSSPVAYGKYPILIQGETSTGKTSLIKYLASATGNKVIRINNHEHTDLQEYVGTYASDSSGKLVFQDGPLVTAMREGYWVILDELNLAPTDILEALNRVLDDNRELFITETQEVVQAHPRFMLFATQNPPGLYGGRKVLSRAFRNRFVELHFNEIPTDELRTILHKRCDLAPSHCSKMVKVMLELQARRRASGLFSGKHGFMTLRDLFRWAERHRRHQIEPSEFYDWEQHLVDDGFLLLAGKVRKEEEEKVIEEVLQKHFGRPIDRHRLFSMEVVKKLVGDLPAEFNHVVWTQPMRRLFVTLERALRFDEPVLLVGDTGGGKTTACQMISAILKRKLSIINCHANTEAADFIGGLRPARHCDATEEQNCPDEKSMKLFEWVDGPLVTNMLDGSHILVDEISLADDSVLERLNSVLEPERTLVIPDKASLIMEEKFNESQFVAAQTGFQFLATMNPGGDYGKKELSPALRNRMTEIWCSVTHNQDDLTAIVEHNLQLSPQGCSQISPANAKIYSGLVVGFVTWFKSTIFGKRFVISVRDLITWSRFMSTLCHSLDLPSTYVHAACLVYIDGLGSGLSGAFASQSLEAHAECLKFIISQLVSSNQISLMSNESRLWVESEITGKSDSEKEIIRNTYEFGVSPFTIPAEGSEQNLDDGSFSFNAHTTSVNAMRVLRALQLSRPVLLEGSPGGGKTSLVAAIAKAACYNLVRINLSEQTDASDLFGADLPVENGKGGEFSWRDGPLLAAMKAGHWVVLDELNLASQSVLESLNSVFDHRGELFVPELGRSFLVDRRQTKIFACQNPLQEGGGRKGLPKSFLNRFTQVHVDNLSKDDLLFILEASFPQMPQHTLQKMVEFNQKVFEQVTTEKKWGHRGAPWEFNLRDMTRWCLLAVDDCNENQLIDVSKYVYLIYCERLRWRSDKEKMLSLFYEVFGQVAYYPTRYFHMDSNYVQIGNSVMTRRSHCFLSNFPTNPITPSLLQPAEAMVAALNKNWPCILTGGPKSGKSLLVKTVASLAGRRLRVLSTNSTMDTIELLGGYEQSDITKTFLDLVDKAIKILLAACQDQFIAANSEKKLTEVQNLLTAVERMWKYAEMVESKMAESSQVDPHLQIENELSSAMGLAKNAIVHSTTSQQLQDVLEDIKKLRLRKDMKGTYEWSDSILVKALKEGDWLLVDGANFCSASVLDRLNALLEPNGTLTVTERGVVDGNVSEIRPHEDFRLIFSLDPFYGELSRAMRNRCVEVHLPTGEDVLDSFDVNSNWQGLTWNEVRSINQAACANSNERKACEASMQFQGNFSAKLNAMVSAQDLLEQMRYGLHSSRLEDEHVEDQRKSTPHVRSPSVRDFVVRPALSVIMRQFKILENLQSCNNFEFTTTLASYFRVLIELATNDDRHLRISTMKRVLPSMMQNNDTTRYLDLFANVTNAVFTTSLWKVPGVDVPQMNLPWDPRWNLQALPKTGFTGGSVDASTCGKIMLHVVYLLLKCEEDRQSVSFARKKKGMFQLSSGYSSGKLIINDLPHASLVFLLPLYKAWNKALNDILSCGEAQVAGENTFVRCEGNLRRISYIWRQLMECTFSLSYFTNWYLHLKKELNSFVQSLGMVESDLWRKVQDIVENLDKSLQIDGHFEDEYKTQNRVRSALIGDSVQVFQDEMACVTRCCAQAMLSDLSNYAVAIVREQSKTALTWSDVIMLVTKLVKLQSDLCQPEGVNSQRASDVDEMDADETSPLLEIQVFSDAFCENGISLSLGTITLLEKAKIAVHKNTSKDSLTVHDTLSLPDHKLQLWPLSDFMLFLSELNAFSSDFIADKMSSDCTDLAVVEKRRLFIKSAITDKASLTSFNLRTYLLSKCLNWPYHRLHHGSCDNADALSEQQFSLLPDGIGNLLKPHITENVIFLLYSGAEPKIPSQCLSLTRLNELYFWGGLKVPLKNVAEKLFQLKNLSNNLWYNTALLTQIGSGNAVISPQLLNSLVGCLGSFHALLIACRRSGGKFFLIKNKKFSIICRKLSDDLLQCDEKLDPRLHHHCTELATTAKVLSENDMAVEFRSVWLDSVTSIFTKCTNLVVKTLKTIQNVKEPETGNGCDRKHWALNCWRLVGEAWTWIGYFQMLLVSPRGSVDPIERQRTKVEFLSAEVKIMTKVFTTEFREKRDWLMLSHCSTTLQCEQGQCDLDVRNMSERNLKGHDLVTEDRVIVSRFYHPRIEASLQHVGHLERKIKKSQSKTAYRPAGTHFYQLSKDCFNFMSTAASRPSLNDLIKQLTAKKLRIAASQTEEKMQHSFSAFSRALEEKYSAYPDFVKPMQDSVAQMRFGLSLVRKTSEILSFHQTQQNKMATQTKAVANITPEEFLSLFINGDFTLADLERFIALVKSLSGEAATDASFKADRMIDTILSTSLLDFHDTVINNHERFDYRSLSGLMDSVVGLWNKRQEAIDKKEAEKASLYKYKSQSHELNEEEEIEEEFNSMFPTFYEDIEDLMDSNDLNDIPVKKEDVSVEKENPELELSAQLFDMTALIHSDIVTRSTFKALDVRQPISKPLTKKQKKKNAKKQRLITDAATTSPKGRLSMLYSHYMTFTHVASVLGSLYGGELDHALIRNHLITCSKLEEFLSSKNAQDTQKEAINIYTEGSPAEIGRCLTVLNEMRAEVTDKLLTEWPDHPVLNVLITIIDRILSFSVTFPLMKFVTGLELLLGKAQEWEVNASHHVSLANHLEAVTHLILDWRRLELKSWNKLLDDAQLKASADTTKWWFYIYQLVEDCLSKSNEENYRALVCDVITALQKFVESSNIGQYEGRTKLLEVFHRHCLLKGSGKDALSAALFNLHGYYTQFVKPNQERIEALRNPIEKELKNFIKIAKWNDINFYAVRDSVNKTHRTLFKLVKKFSSTLLEVVSLNVLVTSPVGFTSLSEGMQSQGLVMCGRWKELCDDAVATGSKPNENLSRIIYNFFSGVSDTEATEVQRLPTILSKLHQHRTSLLHQSNAFMPQLLISFEENTSNIIENFKIIRALEPATPTSRDEELQKKRLSEAKHIQARKRRALSDLFKSLRLLGLSYRKGIVWSKTFQSKEIMLSPSPRSVQAAAETASTGFDDVTSDSIVSAERYFYKMISRWSTLMSALVSPNKEVGGANNSRMCGFASHLLHLAIKQRQNVTVLRGVGTLLKEATSNLRQCLEYEDLSLPLQQEAYEGLLSSKRAADCWLSSLTKFRELCESAPSEAPEGGPEVVVPPLPLLPKIATCVRNDDVWAGVFTSIQKEIDATEKLRSVLLQNIERSCEQSGQLKQGIFLLPAIVNTIHDSIENLREASAKFCDDMMSLFNTDQSAVGQSENPLTHSPLIADILRGRKTVQSCYQDISCTRRNRDAFLPEDTTLHQLNDLLSQVMLAVQNLVKNIEGMEDFNLTDDGLYESHFVRHINGRVEESYHHLNIGKVEECLLNVVGCIKKISGSEKSKPVLALVVHSLLPILEEYEALASQTLLSTSLVHRSTCKLTFVLSSIFSEVASKGFCPPAEFEEELAGDKGELKEVEDAGIGEGEGSKDVSDQIEEENQVEDVPGSEAPEQKDEDITPEDNAIEMSNDFDAKFQDDAPMEEKDESDEEDEEEDLDKQMGDLGKEEDTDKLDERMWGSDDEEEEENKDTKEEKGAGMDADQSELAAKDDDVGEANDEEEKEKNPNENLEDQSEFDPNERDDTHEKEPHEPPEPLEFPDDVETEGDDDRKENGDEQNEDEVDNGNQEETSGAMPDSMETEDPDEGTDPDETLNEEDHSDEGKEDNEDVEEPIKSEPNQENVESLEKEDDETAEEEEEEVKAAQENEKKQSEGKDEEAEKEEETKPDQPSGPGTQLPQEEDTPEDEEVRDKTSRSKDLPTEDDVVQCENANEQTSQQTKDEGKDERTSGTAPSTDQNGHDSANLTTQSVTDNNQNKERPSENESKIGQSDSKRTLGDATSHLPKRLKLLDELKEAAENDENDNRESENAEIYQHISKDVKEYDIQTRDAATDEQISQQPVADDVNEEEEVPVNNEPDGKADDQVTSSMEVDDGNEDPACDVNGKMTDTIIAADVNEEEPKEDTARAVNEEVDEKDLPMSSVHSNVMQREVGMEFMALTHEEISRIRLEMEEHLRSAPQVDPAAAEAMWHQYQSVTQPLSQQLSEQLRLILEPTQAAKLKGDFRSGKRLNMRKVIPYIASGFRKDKIWLRRSKPSKREYQIMVAIDDSSSMADNHTKQLAFESLAVISTALTTLEAGQLAVCNFGEETQLLHDFSQQFTDQSGASVLQQCSFKQEQTKVARLLDTCVKFLKAAQSNYTSSADPRLSQLLLIISDGRGLYIEGKERVEAAVRAAKNARIFLAFIVLDNPTVKDSVLDIKVPVFKESGKIEIRSYMSDFPFPFYVIIRNINVLPETLSEALRQWFEMVTSGD